MQDQVPKPEIQATADLSPVSPSPLHSVAPLVVPALQDTADTLDAMSAGANETAQGDLEQTMPTAVSSPDDSAADRDSFDDAYGEQEEETAKMVPAQVQEPDAADDDYLKTFDSPIEAEEGDNGVQDDVSKAPESIQTSVSSDHMTSLSTFAPSSDDASKAEQPVANKQTLPPTFAAQPEAALSKPTLSPTQGQYEASTEDATAIDISRLVAEITGQTSSITEPSGAEKSQSLPQKSTHKPETLLSPALTSSPSASLPPRPPLPQQTVPSFDSPEEYRSLQHQPSASNVPSGMTALPNQGQPSAYIAAGAPGTYTEAISSLPPPPANAFDASAASTASSLNATSHGSNHGFPSQTTNDFADHQRLWDTFVADERRYMSEAKWDRFPDGSRIFIGNLSSERVSKRDVFDIFHRHGRLAQISLKSAYGFVQYHTVEDAQSAMESLQGIEIKGRKIHLEVSRTQKKDKGGDRARSPDRGARGGRDSNNQRSDRFDGGGTRRRDDYRPGRNSSPRRSNGSGREDSYGRERPYYDSQNRSDASGRPRGRSRSPPSHGRPSDPYRRRSPSPAHAYGRSGPADHDQLDIPRRYGAQVPDVQLLLLQEVGRDFIAWVERAFTDRGLKTDVMFLHPNFPREAVIQRQVIEGVHAIVELDMRAHSYGKIPLRVFDRSSGMNARYDDYRDLDPPIAAELVLRAKTQASYHAQPPQQPSYAVGGYSQGYPPQVSPHTPTFPGAPIGQHQRSSSAADIAGVMGQIDNATLQRLLASLNTPQNTSAAPSNPMSAAPQPRATNPAIGMANGQLDVQALLNSMKAGAAPPASQSSSYGSQAYPPVGAPSHGSSHPTGNPGDAAAVQSIMAQLARYRQ